MARRKRCIQCMHILPSCHESIFGIIYVRNDFNAEIGDAGLARLVNPAGESDVVAQFERVCSKYIFNALHNDAGRGVDDAMPAAQSKHVPPHLGLALDKYMLPILPQVKENINTDDINILIRSFLVIHYRKRTSICCIC